MADGLTFLRTAVAEDGAEGLDRAGEEIGARDAAGWPAAAQMRLHRREAFVPHRHRAANAVRDLPVAGPGQNAILMSGRVPPLLPVLDVEMRRVRLRLFPAL